MQGESTCLIDGCPKPRWARGFCGLHYQRWRTKGDPNRVKVRHAPRGLSEEGRFWFYVDTNGPEMRPELGNCWTWTGGLAHGYGQFHRDGGRPELAHRYAYRLATGEEIKGFDICHSCDNPTCPRPDHLFKGTALDNVRDMWAKDRQVIHPVPRGDANRLTKLSDANVQRVRTLYLAGGWTYQGLAGRFRVSPALIGQIVNHKARRYS